ncbi:unnamed protein product [Polarella glacialis]|nr:unnamed protein product [Polarella glacialis]
MQANPELEVDLVTYNAAVAVCSSSVQWEFALALVEEMTSAGPRPDLVTASSLAQALEAAQQWPKLVPLLSSLVDVLGLDLLQHAWTRGQRDVTNNNDNIDNNDDNSNDNNNNDNNDNNEDSEYIMGY